MPAKNALLLLCALCGCSTPRGSSGSPNVDGGTAGADSGGTGTGGAGGAGTAAAGGSSGAGSSVSGASTGGMPSSCSNDLSVPSYPCENGATADFACGPYRAGNTSLQLTEAAVYLLVPTGNILRWDKTLPGAATLIATPNGSASSMVVQEPYVYWVAGGAVGRTPVTPGAPPEILVETCFPSARDLLVDATSVYWGTSPPQYQNARLRIDRDSPAPAANVLLEQADGHCVGTDDERIYCWSELYISAADKDATCSCACSAATPDAPLACTPVAGGGSGTGGSPGFVACSDHPPTTLYVSEGMLIQDAALDSSHVYWRTRYGISRVDKQGEVAAVLPVLDVAAPSHFIQAFALDATDVYAHRELLDTGSPVSAEIVRVAKDGSEVTPLYERPIEDVVALAVDDSSLYFLVAGSGRCTFTLERLPKSP